MRSFCKILAACAAAGCALQLHAQQINGIMAVVHDSIITREDVEALTETAGSALWRQYRNQPELFQKKLDQARTDNLETLLSHQLILRDFKTAGYNLPDSVIEEMVLDRIHVRFGDRMKLIKSLQAEGITYDKFKQQIRDQFIIEALTQKNVSSEIMISPHKVETYYLAHRAEFKLEDQVKLRMIVLNRPAEGDTGQARRLGEDILRKLKEGATFAEMATIHSEGSQRKEGGDWGWVERSVLRKELSDVAFTLKPGEISGVIETPGACYLMLVEEAKPAHNKSLGEVRDQIEKNLLLEEKSRLRKQWIDRLRKKTFVRYF